MAKIAAYRVTDFSGGVHREKSPFELQKNELLDARNVEIEERGRLITRRGGQQVGQTLSGNIENAFVFIAAPDGGSPSVQFLVNNNSSTAALYKLLSPGRLATSITTASTTIILDSGVGTAPLASSGVVEIEGDLISYTAKAGDGITLTGVTGISKSHTAGVAVEQWSTVTQSGSALDGQMGISYAVLNNICVICGRLGNLKQINAGGTVSEISSEPAILFLTNYKDRLYGAGDGSAGTNGSPVRMSFSARGDGTSWTTFTDYVDVNDQEGEYITGFKEYNDTLGVFKTNSIFTYNEIELKQRVKNVGAYNDKVIQEVSGRLFTFCPDGIFETNLYSARQIGHPVQEFWKGFKPEYDATGLQRVVTNTWAASYLDKYLLFMVSTFGLSTEEQQIVLEFNTSNNSWTVYSGGFDNFLFLNGFHAFRFGDSSLTVRPALFGGTSSGSVFRLYDNIFRDRDGDYHGNSIFRDLTSNTGLPINSLIETPLYDLTYPELFKKFKRLRLLLERGQWNVEYRVENEKEISAYRPLGSVGKTSSILPFPSEAQGYRVGFRLTSVNTAASSMFNGLVIEDTEVIPRPNA